MITKPGLYPEITMADYLADPCAVPSLSSGCAHTLLSQSPFHAWRDHPKCPNRRERDESSVADIGSIVHALLLENTDENVVVIDAPDYRKKEAQAIRDAARAEGKHPILAHKLPAVQTMVDAARAYLATSDLAGILDDGMAEATMLWQQDGVWCRARQDWISGDKSVLLHVKTTGGSAEPNAWIRSQLLNSGYDIAAVHYEQGAHAVGMDRAQSIFLVIEQDAPHGCSLVGLNPELRAFATAKWQRAVRAWRRCLITGQWPAYPLQIAYAEAPAWAVAQFQERELVDAFAVDPVQEQHGVQA